jgi:hypothetical protein
MRSREVGKVVEPEAGEDSGERRRAHTQRLDRMAVELVLPRQRCGAPASMPAPWLLLHLRRPRPRARRRQPCPRSECEDYLKNECDR